MRVQPVANSYNYGVKNNNLNTQFESKTYQNFSKNNHIYTGCASVDLAYVSMFDNAIAKDLKLMGLI